MGCYKMICAATNTIINEGDEVVLFSFINRLKENNPVYCDELMEAFFVPIEGKYDDYGFIEDVNERYYKESFSLFDDYLTKEFKIEKLEDLNKAFGEIKYNSKNLLRKKHYWESSYALELNYFFVKKSFLELLIKKRSFEKIEKSRIFFKFENVAEIENMKAKLAEPEQYYPQLQYWAVIYEWFALTGRNFKTIVSGTQEYYLENVFLMKEFLELELKDRYKKSEDDIDGYYYESDDDDEGRRLSFEEWKENMK